MSAADRPLNPGCSPGGPREPDPLATLLDGDKRSWTAFVRRYAALIVAAVRSVAPTTTAGSIRIRPSTSTQTPTAPAIDPAPPAAMSGVPTRADRSLRISPVTTAYAQPRLAAAHYG